MTGEPIQRRPVALASSEFEARTIAAVLEDAEIDAVVVAPGSWPTEGFGLTPNTRGVPVLVALADLEKARKVLHEADDISSSIEWDEVDVGARDDDLPLRSTRHLPLIAWIGFGVALLIMIGFLVWGLAMGATTP